MLRKKIAGTWTDEMFLTALYAEEQYIYRISYVYLKQEQEALENVQEVAFRAWKYRKSLKEVTYFKTWLTRITINSALCLLKKHQQLTLTYEDTGAVDDIESSSFENLVVDQLYLADLLERLEVKERSLLLLRYQADYSFQEIADLLDIPVSTVKSTLYRAIQKLQRQQMKGGESG
ncbi:sigma-70 family RNA polymerase sigma factor [Exiguobacterium sp. RIT452]|uniref:RNA polymerase sigma factor n=1 Tax=Exiguobacterium sp. RIT452 TaxID=2315552 RepID=UPI000E7455FB|nr:sigma-70 family RNA polymerase sigma factor [Exiguobacterium sp. RIT452]RJP02667.1 sigma-70 family RNA polymerase sigma factor [Exiguobacterium sp. RIT452]